MMYKINAAVMLIAVFIFFLYHNVTHYKEINKPCQQACQVTYNTEGFIDHDICYCLVEIK